MWQQAMKYLANPWVMLVLSACIGPAHAAGQYWRIETPFARTTTLDALIWDGSRFWSAGSGGSLAVSGDGSQWRARVSATDSHLYAMARDNQGRLIAVGQAGAMVTDGGVGIWAPLRAMTSADLRAIGTDGDAFVAVGDDGVLLYSADGHVWNRQALPAVAAQTRLRTVAWQAGLWLAAGDGGTILSSSDGQQWQIVNNPSAVSIFALSWWPARSLWLAAAAGGTVLTSPDGQQWNAISAGVTTDLLAVTIAGNEAFVAGRQGAVSHSADGQNWIVATTSVSDDLRAIATAASGRLLAVGGDAVALISDDSGLSWQVTRPHRQQLRDVAVNGAGQWLAVGLAGTLMRSDDASLWLPQALPSGRNHSGLAWDGSIFWAVGDGGEILRGNADGRLWSIVTPQTCPRTLPAGRWTTATAENLQAITFAAGRYVAVGAGGAIVDSPDGLVWCAQSVSNAQIGSPAPLLADVASDGQSFVAVGGQGNLLVSADGVNWSHRNSLTSAPLKSVLWDGQRWNVVGEGVLLTSVDSIHWQLERSLQLASGNGLARLNDHTLGPAGVLIATGYLGVLATSDNGVDWATQDSGFGDLTLNGVAASSTVIVAVGDGGMILSSRDDADLAVSVQPVSGARQGQTAVLSVTVDNTGAVSAPASTVVIDLPADLTIAGVRTSMGSCATQALRITCSLGDVPPVTGRALIDIDLLPRQAGTRDVTIRGATTGREVSLADNVVDAPVVVAAALPNSVSVGERLSGAGAIWGLLLAIAWGFGLRRWRERAAQGL